MSTKKFVIVMLSGVRRAKHPVHLNGKGCFGGPQHDMSTKKFVIVMLSGVRGAKHLVHLNGKGCFGGPQHDMSTKKFVKDILLNLNLAPFRCEIEAINHHVMPGGESLVTAVSRPPPERDCTNFWQPQPLCSLARMTIRLLARTILGIALGPI
ncbi:MAG: hypothetical protein KBE23_00760 [Chloroflexi bacterium]|nr:hypothetical protein [Chloroflexota bacterium]